MDDYMTVDRLAIFLKRLSEAGNGDMKIRCVDGFLHADEIKVNYMDNEMMLRGYLFNVPVAEKISKFCADIEKAKDEFYGLMNVENYREDKSE